MSNPIDDFVSESPEISSASSISQGEFIHIYEGELEDSDTDTVRIFSLAPDIVDQEVQEAFKRTVGQWRNPSTHPNIVTVYDRGTTPRPWVAVELVDGDRLDECRADLSTVELGKVIADSAEAIRNANLYNTIHSALSPNVIWIIQRDDGMVGKVDEWGLERSCRVAAGENPLSAYSAPELVEDPKNATAQIDIYGLGAIAYYALTGQPPVPNADEDISESLSTGDITPPSQLNPSITEEIDEVLLRALSRLPTNRYQSIHDFQSAFVDALPTQEELDTSDFETSDERSTKKQNQDASNDQTSRNQSPSSQTGADTSSRNEEIGDRAQSASSTFLTRRKMIIASGIAGVGATGFLGLSSDSEQTEIADTTPTATSTPVSENTQTPTSTPEDNTPTPSKDGGTDTPEQGTPTRDIDWFPMFCYDAANTSHKSSGAGPTTYLTEKWKFETPVGIVSSPTVVEGIVYVGTNNGTIYAVNSSDGSQKWSYQADDKVRSSPAIVDGTVYVGSDDGNLYALDAKSGDEDWVFQSSNTIFSSPSVVDGNVYFGNDAGNIYSIDMSNGEKQWSYQTGDEVRSSPAITDRSIFIGSNDRNLYALDAEDGTEQWAFEAGSSIRSSPVVRDSTVYVGCDDTILYALDTTTDTIADFERKKWGFQTQNQIFSSPAIANSTVYVGSGAKVYAINISDGSVDWSFSTSGRVRSSPAVGGRTVYVGCDMNANTAEDNTIYGIDAVNGTQTTQFEPSQSILSSPAVGEETIYLGGSRVNLFALTAGY